MCGSSDAAGGMSEVPSAALQHGGLGALQGQGGRGRIRLSIVSLVGWKCDFSDCGHVWYSPQEPTRCSKCKRKNWNKSGPKSEGAEVSPGSAKPERRKNKSTKKREKRSGASSRASKGKIAAVPVEMPGHITTGDVLEDITRSESTSPGWEKSLTGIPAHIDDISTIAPTYGGISRSTPLATVTPEPSERIQKLIEEVVRPAHKVGEKCPHGWANWMQCPKCNGRKE